MNLLERYTKVSKILQNSINLLTEEFVGDKFYIYHGSPSKNLESIFTFGFERYFAGKTTGEVYGSGIYSTYDLESTISNLRKGNYGGSLIIKAEVFSLNNFIIYDKEVAERIYKDKWSVKDQFDLIFPPEVINELKKISYYVDGYNSLYDFLIDQNTTYTSDQCYQLYDSRRHFNSLKIKSPYDYLDGFIFYGRNDGKICIIKDFKNAIPIEYSKNMGETWVKKESKELKKYTLDDFDSKYRFGNKYKDVDVPFFGYAKVKNDEDKVNYINKLGQELSPYWFDGGTDFDEYPDGRILATVRVEDGYFLLDQNKNIYLSLDDDEKYELEDIF